MEYYIGALIILGICAISYAIYITVFGSSPATTFRAGQTFATYPKVMQLAPLGCPVCVLHLNKLNKNIDS